MPGKPRVGIVDYLNSKPLAWSFLRGDLDDRFEAVYLPPAEVATQLAAGELEVGLIPSIEYQRIPHLKLVPGLCVGAEHEVRSVLLVSSVPVGEIRRLALDRNSRTSAALVRIVLRDRYGVEPEATEAEADLPAMLASNDAALLIGDPALAIDTAGLRVLDLAHEWRQLTGHPFVFAVWAARAEASLPDLEATLSGSLSTGLADLDLLIAEASAALDMAEPEIREYLTENLHFRLGEDERAGLEEFYRRAAALGFIDNVRPLRFV